MGKYTYVDGSIEEGEWLRDGKMHGVGIRIWANGDRYEGSLFNGVQHGWGAYVFGNGKVVKGEWENGELIRLSQRAAEVPEQTLPRQQPAGTGAKVDSGSRSEQAT